LLRFTTMVFMSIRLLFVREYLNMKSIYSLDVLQRIADHWGIGKITDITYFEAIGRGIWRHLLDTNQGEFELYSYSTLDREYAHQKIQEFTEHLYGQLRSEFFHSFDRYHELRQLNQKIPISSKQVEENIQSLPGLKVIKIFRVYGSIVQMYLEDETVLYSYAHWGIKKLGFQEKVVVDTWESSYEELDVCLEMLRSLDVKFASLKLIPTGCELSFSEDFLLSFSSTPNFVSLQMRVAGHKNYIHIESEKKMWYLKELK